MLNVLRPPTLWIEADAGRVMRVREAFIVAMCMHRLRSHLTSALRAGLLHPSLTCIHRLHVDRTPGHGVSWAPFSTAAFIPRCQECSNRLLNLTQGLELSHSCSKLPMAPRDLFHQRKMTSSARYSESSHSFRVLPSETSVHLQPW